MTDYFLKKTDVSTYHLEIVTSHRYVGEKEKMLNKIVNIQDSFNINREDSMMGLLHN